MFQVDYPVLIDAMIASAVPLDRAFNGLQHGLTARNSQSPFGIRIDEQRVAFHMDEPGFNEMAGRLNTLAGGGERSDRPLNG